MQKADAERGKTFTRERSTDRDSFGSLGNTLPGTGEGPTIAAGRLALMELQLGMLVIASSPQRPIIPETKSGAAAIKARPAAMRLSAAEHGPDRGVGGVGYLIPRTPKAGIRRRQRRTGNAPKKFDRTGRPSITKTERPRSANLLQMPRSLMCKPRQRGPDYAGQSRRIDPSLQPVPPCWVLSNWRR